MLVFHDDFGKSRRLENLTTEAFAAVLHDATREKEVKLPLRLALKDVLSTLFVPGGKPKYTAVFTVDEAVMALQDKGYFDVWRGDYLFNRLATPEIGGHWTEYTIPRIGESNNGETVYALREKKRVKLPTFSKGYITAPSN
jgi:hypothetical protein